MSSRYLLVGVAAFLAVALLGVESRGAAIRDDDDDDQVTVGSIAYAGLIPWHVAVVKVGAGQGDDFEYADLLGSGALVSRSYVLTAASALSDTPTDLTAVSVLLGALNPRNVGLRGKRIDSKQLVRHPDWDNETALNDIALVQLNTPADLGETINPVRLPPRYYEGASYVGHTVTVCSWGLYDDANGQGWISVYNAQVIRNMDCQSAQSDPSKKLPWTKMCILSPEHSAIPARIDHGGVAVFLESDHVYTVVGVVSDNAHSNLKKPSTLTRITEQLDWIQQNSDVQID